MSVTELPERKDNSLMNKVTIIPPTLPESPCRYQKIPGKFRVVGYTCVIKGARTGNQIRKNIKRHIAAHNGWELIGVITDYSETENQYATMKNFFRILSMIKFKYIDILIVYTVDDLYDTLNFANIMLPDCMHYGVALYIAHNNMLLSEEDFIL